MKKNLEQTCVRCGALMLRDKKNSKSTCFDCRKAIVRERAKEWHKNHPKIHKHVFSEAINVEGGKRTPVLVCTDPACGVSYFIETS